MKKSILLSALPHYMCPFARAKRALAGRRPAKGPHYFGKEIKLTGTHILRPYYLILPYLACNWRVEPRALRNGLKELQRLAQMLAE
jgi:hypothetical protein